MNGLSSISTRNLDYKSQSATSLWSETYESLSTMSASWQRLNIISELCFVCGWIAIDLRSNPFLCSLSLGCICVPRFPAVWPFVSSLPPSCAYYQLFLLFSIPSQGPGTSCDLAASLAFIILGYQAPDLMALLLPKSAYFPARILRNCYSQKNIEKIDFPSLFEFRGVLGFRAMNFKAKMIFF